MVTNNAPAERVVAIHRRLDVGHSLPLRRKGKYFFLDIPFYRTPPLAAARHGRAGRSRPFLWELRAEPDHQRISLASRTDLKLI
jgi:hypothetical protein